MNIENEFNDSTYNEYLITKADLTRIPIMGTFELTPICNMRCNMCYIQQDSKKICQNGGLKNVDFWEKLIDDSIKEGMLFCLLTGGEIFTYPYFKELYKKIIKKPIYVVLNTNATLLNEETIQWLAKNPPRRLNISLYGSNNNTYEKLCHLSDGFDRVMNAFQLLNKYNIPFRVNSVLVPSNIQDFDNIIDICNEIKAHLEFADYMFPPLRKDMNKLKINERFTPTEMAKVTIKINKAKCDTYEVWKNFINETVNKITNYKDNPHYKFDKMICKSGRNSFWVNWKGEISGCGISYESICNLKNTSFEESWNNIVNYSNNVTLSQKCATCKYKVICPTCLASAVCETGSVDGTPEYLCEYCEEYYKLILEEYERLSKDE